MCVDFVFVHRIVGDLLFRCLLSIAQSSLPFPHNFCALAVMQACCLTDAFKIAIISSPVFRIEVRDALFAEKSLVSSRLNCIDLRHSHSGHIQPHADGAGLHSQPDGAGPPTHRYTPSFCVSLLRCSAV
jgi:hypothetical protein